jgi:pimeloyl-ACP methyl ester carboxylesterase
MTRTSAAALVGALAVAQLAACHAPSVNDSPAAAESGSIARSIDIGEGRRLFLNCQGSGSPTIFIIPGKGSYAEVWNYAIPKDDQARSSPYDMITQAKLEPSPDAVQPTLARSARVCAYDRPNTRPDGADRSTPVPQPHTAAQDVDDLIALFAAADLKGPFIVVAHSYGGMVADLLARTHPALVRGVVMVDPISEFLPDVGSPAQNAAFDNGGPVPETPGGEGIEPDVDYAEVRAAPPLPKVPAAVLSSDKFQPPAGLTPDNYTLEQIHRANSMLAAALGTTNTTKTDSGHSIMLYQPQLVADAIMQVRKLAAG